jgi:hypothetical protein
MFSRMSNQVAVKKNVVRCQRKSEIQDSSQQIGSTNCSASRFDRIVISEADTMFSRTGNRVALNRLYYDVRGRQNFKIVAELSEVRIAPLLALIESRFHRQISCFWDVNVINKILLNKIPLQIRELFSEFRWCANWPTIAPIDWVTQKTWILNIQFCFYLV